jgi:hypothetical protein
MDALQQFLSAYRSLCPGAGIVIRSRGDELDIDISVATEFEVRTVAAHLNAEVTAARDVGRGTWFIATHKALGLRVVVSALVQASKEVA